MLGEVYIGLGRANSAALPVGEEPSSLFVEGLQVSPLSPRPVNFSGPSACGSGWGRLGWDAAPRGCRLGDAAWQTSRLAMAHCFPIPAETKFQGEFLGMCTHFPNMWVRACPASSFQEEEESESKRVTGYRFMCLQVQVCGQETDVRRSRGHELKIKF